MPLTRRTLLHAAGVLAIPRAAAAATPDAHWTQQAHARIAQTTPSELPPAERVTLSAIADAIIPRTDTPGALEVAVPAFVELLIMEWVTPADRDAVREGLRDLDAHAVATHQRPWAALDSVQRQGEMAWGERDEPTLRAGQRTFRRLKSWITHGWLTSERIQRDVLRVAVIPGTYDGCAPMPTGGPR